MPQSRALRFSAAPAVHGSPGRVRGSGRGAREGGHCAPGSCSLGAAPVYTGTLPGGRAHTRRPAGGMWGTEAPESSLSREGAPARLGSSSQRTGEGGQQCRRQARARRGGGDVGVGAPRSGVQLADRSWAWSRQPRPRPAPLSCAVLGVKVGPWTEASGCGGECPGLDTLEGRAWWGRVVGTRRSHCCGHHPGLCPPRRPQNESGQDRQGLGMLCPPHLPLILGFLPLLRPQGGLKEWHSLVPRPQNCVTLEPPTPAPATEKTSGLAEGAPGVSSTSGGWEGWSPGDALDLSPPLCPARPEGTPWALSLWPSSVAGLYRTPTHPQRPPLPQGAPPFA